MQVANRSKLFIRPIKPEILEWFRGREFLNYYWLKQLPASELDTYLDKLDPKPLFSFTPYERQKVMFLIGAWQKQWIFWSDMGTGKTAVALSLIDYRKGTKPALVVVPDQANIGNWMDECKVFVPHLKVVPIIGTKAQREAAVNQDGDIFIINYDGLQHLLNSSGKRYIEIQPEHVAQFASNFETLIYDELVYSGNTKSITWQICNLLSKQITNRYGLTGRPFSRDLEALWRQFFVIDSGKTLGKNIYLFRQGYFIPKDKHFNIEWNLDPDQKLNFIRATKNITIRYSSAETQDLPEKVNVPISIELNEEAKVYYRKLKKDLIALPKDQEWLLKIKSTFPKFRQICSGYLILNNEEVDEETGEVTVKDDEVIDFENSKEKPLEQIIEQLPEGKKLVIFYAYTPSGQKIVDKLKELKVKHVWLYGGTKDKIGTLSAFKTNPKVRVLVVNIKSGSVGLNLQVANYMLFYENAITAQDRAQAEKRIHRDGQKEQVFIYDFIIKNSIEERIMKHNQEGEALFQAIVEGASEEQIKEAERHYKESFINFTDIEQMAGDI